MHNYVISGKYDSPLTSKMGRGLGCGYKDQGFKDYKGRRRILILKIFLITNPIQDTN